jgi:transposase
MPKVGRDHCAKAGRQHRQKQVDVACHLCRESDAGEWCANDRREKCCHANHGVGRRRRGDFRKPLNAQPPEWLLLSPAIEQGVAIPPEAKEMFALLGQQIDEIDARIKDVDAKLNAAHKASEVSQRLVTIPGVGPVTALTLAVEIDPAMFESGRHLAAWAGLTPKERSTGGKQRMGGISRAGNERLRVLLVSGATAVINAAMRPGSQQMTEWLRALLLRKPRKLAAVALANKMARTAWAMMKRGETYRRPSAAAGAVAA